MTSLRDELSRDLPALSAPRLGLIRSRLANEVERLAQLYEGALDVAVHSNDYNEVKAALELGVDALNKMPRRLLYCVPFMLLHDNDAWRANEPLVKAYLSRLERGRTKGGRTE
jgi:hypothetical protein